MEGGDHGGSGTGAQTPSFFPAPPQQGAESTVKGIVSPSIDSSRVRQLAYYPASKWQSEVQVQVCLIPKPMFFLGNDV